MSQKTQPVGVTVNVAGTATASLVNYGPATFTVGQVSVEMTNAGGSASGAVRKGGVLVAPFVPQADSVSGDPAVVLYPGESMSVVWTSATPGATGTALFIFDDGQR